MRIKLFGTEIYISFLFSAVVTIMLATDRTGLMLPSVFAITMHELGHLFAMWCLECNPKRIKLIPTSIQITSNFSKGYKNDIIIALCGPIVNIILFFSLYFNYLAYQNNTVLYFSLVNLVIGIFNVLPLWELDGGTILYSIIAQKSQPNRAALTVKIITRIVGVGIFLTAVYLTVKGKINFSLYIMAIYLFIGVIIKM